MSCIHGTFGCLWLHQVSATFAASLVTSPAIGAYLSAWYGDNLVVLLATLIALADICFILLAVPESLPDKMRLNTWGAPISWEQADPFAVSWYILLANSDAVAVSENELFSVPVSEEGWSRLNSPAHLYHRVPVLPAGGWPVLQLLPLPETGDAHGDLRKPFCTQ